MTSDQQPTSVGATDDLGRPVVTPLPDVSVSGGTVGAIGDNAQVTQNLTWHYHLPAVRSRKFWVVLVVLLALLTSGAWGFVAVLDVLRRPANEGPAPSVETQIALVRAKMTANGFDVTVWSVHLHPDGKPSSLLVAKPTNAERTRHPSANDQLLIYDQDASGRLNKAFAFEPTAVRLSDPGPLPASAHADVFTFPLNSNQPKDIQGLNSGDSIQVANVDGAEGDEVLGSVTELGTEQDVWPRPFMIAWDAVNRRYVLQALLSPESTSLPSMGDELVKPTGGPLDYANVLYRHVYMNPTPIRNGKDNGDQILQAYAPQFYVLQQLQADHSFQGGNAGLLQLRAAYAVYGASAGMLRKMQIIDWKLFILPNGGGVTAYPVNRPKLLNVGVSNSSSKIEELLEQLQ